MRSPRIFKLRLLTAAALFSLSPCLLFTARSESINRCSDSTTSSSLSSKNKIQDLDDLLRAFTQGLVPNLLSPSQRSAFEIYLRRRFGDPRTELNPGTFDEIAREVQNHPKLTKEPFRDYQLIRQERSYPVTP